jgi:hypothetical protein
MAVAALRGNKDGDDALPILDQTQFAETFEFLSGEPLIHHRFALQPTDRDGPPSTTNTPDHIPVLQQEINHVRTDPTLLAAAFCVHCQITVHNHACLPRIRLDAHLFSPLRQS